MNPVTLIEREIDGIDILLTAEVDSKGELVLSGQDLGPRVEELWGDMDYEYRTAVSPDQTLEVLVQLLQDAFHNLLDLQSWLESAGVQYRLVASVIGEENFTVEVNQSQILIHKEPGTHRMDSEGPVLAIDRKYKDKLLLLLLQENFKRKVFANDSEFHGWLKRKNIEYEFSSYG